MGRYYNGDIEGKFWVAVQSSADADFFGVTGYQPEWLEYEFEQEDLENVQAGIKTCNEKLGKYKKKLDEFFEKNFAYNDKMLEDAGIPPAMAEWYARLQLGEKIENSIKVNGQCYFSAEY